MRPKLLCLGIVGTLVAVDGCAMHHSASQDTAKWERGRLSVRPREVALGKETVHAGVQALDSLYGNGDSLITGTVVYVPERCVGTKRAPLVILLHGDHTSGRSIINTGKGLLHKFADEHGLILLAPTSYSEDRGWGNITTDTAPHNVDVPRIDAAIRLALKHYAIDPKRIAIVGQSAGSGAALKLGYVNGDVFSRVMLFAGFGPFLGDHELDFLTPHGKAPMFIGMNTRESNGLNMPAFASLMRRWGYSVTLAVDSGGHALTPERGAAGFNWLTTDWR